jgi:anti-anti-sigma factor
MLVGDLDLAVADDLRSKLHELKAANQPVRLDLSQLQFIDTSGIRTLLRALDEAQDGWTLTIDRQTQPHVEQIIQITGLRSVIWPTNTDTPSR